MSRRPAVHTPLTTRMTIGRYAFPLCQFPWQGGTEDNGKDSSSREAKAYTPLWECYGLNFPEAAQPLSMVQNSLRRPIRSGNDRDIENPRVVFPARSTGISFCIVLEQVSG